MAKPAAWAAVSQALPGAALVLRPLGQWMV